MKILNILSLMLFVNLNQLRAAELPKQEEYNDFDKEAFEAYINGKSEVLFISPEQNKPMEYVPKEEIIKSLKEQIANTPDEAFKKRFSDLLSMVEKW